MGERGLETKDEERDLSRGLYEGNGSGGVGVLERSGVREVPERVLLLEFHTKWVTPPYKITMKGRGVGL